MRGTKLELRRRWTVLLLLCGRGIAVTSRLRVKTRPVASAENTTFDDYDDCSSPPFPVHNFAATVFLFLETPEEEIQRDLMNLVETVFLKSYNDLTFQLCDAPLFRRITNVRASALAVAPNNNDDDAIFDEVIGRSHVANNLTTILQLDVTAECSGNHCTASTPLFHPTWPTQNHYYRAPAAEELGVLLQTSLQQEVGNFISNYLHQQPVLHRNTHSDLDLSSLMIQLVEEEQRIDCSSNPRKNFSTSYSIVGLALRLNNTLVADAGAGADALLGEVFAETFNELTNLSCDKHSRSVASASVSSPLWLFSIHDDHNVDGNEGDGDEEEQEQEESNGGTRQLEDSDSMLSYHWVNLTNYTTLLQNHTSITQTSNSTETATKPPQLQISFSIVGQCRSCHISKSGRFVLFDDTYDSRQQPPRWPSNHGFRTVLSSKTARLKKDATNYNNDAICYCPPGVDVGEGPSEKEFLSVFTRKLDKLGLLKKYTGSRHL